VTLEKSGTTFLFCRKPFDWVKLAVGFELFDSSIRQKGARESEQVDTSKNCGTDGYVGRGGTSKVENLKLRAELNDWEGLQWVHWGF
jgi:hypothetical protein